MRAQALLMATEQGWISKLLVLQGRLSLCLRGRVGVR